jgi:hypothetical protein
VAAFGVTFAFPVIFAIAGRDPESLPALHRAQRVVHRAQAGVLVIIVLAGLYLAHELDAFKYFYVEWGIGVSLLIGALGGAYMMPREKRVVEVAEREVAAAERPIRTLGAEYETLARQLRLAGAFQGILVLVTILFMGTQLGGP